MSIKPIPTCDECGDPAIERFHAILGGTAHCFCSETCRTASRARHTRRPRCETATALIEMRPAAQILLLPCVYHGPFGDEWSNVTTTGWQGG
jgi:hypothetical protein